MTKTLTVANAGTSTASVSSGLTARVLSVASSGSEVLPPESLAGTVCSESTLCSESVLVYG